MGRKLTLRAGERKRVLWLFSSSIPGQAAFNANPIAGTELTGTVELVRRPWFSFVTEQIELRRQNSFAKGYSDADFRIYVTPDQDCEIEFESRHFRAETLFTILAGLFVLAALSAFAAVMLASR